MNLKKIAAGLTFAMMLPTAAFAHGELWYDAKSHLPQFKKIVVYPIKDLDGQFKIDEDENSESYQINDYFNKRFVRKLKMKTISLGASLKENKDLRRDAEKYQSLYDDVSSEQERGEKVFNTTASDGYIIAQINLDKTEPHLSPSKTVTVQMKSWTEEKGGPNGNRTYDVRNWTVRHTIPAQELMLYHLGLVYNMYNRKGDKIMTYRNAEHTYGDDYGDIIGILGGLFGGRKSKPLTTDNYRVEVFKSIVNEFRKDFEDIKDDFKEKDKKIRIPKTIGFKEINLPKNIGGDEYALKSIYFGMKNSAMEYTDAKVDYDGTGKATLNSYYLDRRWVEPYADTYNRLVSSEESDWYDAKGNKHTKTINRYTTEISDHHGYWHYFANVSGIFYLVDDGGRVLVSHGSNETDDKTADAYLHFLKDFYTKVNAYLTGK